MRLVRLCEMPIVTEKHTNLHCRGNSWADVQTFDRFFHLSKNLARLPQQGKFNLKIIVMENPVFIIDIGNIKDTHICKRGNRCPYLIRNRIIHTDYDILTCQFAPIRLAPCRKNKRTKALLGRDPLPIPSDVAIQTEVRLETARTYQMIGKSTPHEGFSQPAAERIASTNELDFHISRSF